MQSGWEVAGGAFQAARGGAAMQARQGAAPDRLGQGQREVQRHPCVQGKAGTVVNAAGIVYRQLIAACIASAPRLRPKIGGQGRVMRVLLLRCRMRVRMLLLVLMMFRLSAGLLHWRTGARVADRLAGKRHALHRQCKHQQTRHQATQRAHEGQC